MARRVLASISRKRTGLPWDSTRCFVGLFAISADRNRISGNPQWKVSLISPLRPVTTERVEHSRDDLGRGTVQRLAPLLASAAWGRLHADRFGGTGYHVAQAVELGRAIGDDGFAIHDVETPHSFVAVPAVTEASQERRTRLMLTGGFHVVGGDIETPCWEEQTTPSAIEHL